MRYGTHNNVGTKEGNHCVIAVSAPGIGNSLMTQETPGYQIMGQEGIYTEYYRAQFCSKQFIWQSSISEGKSY